MKNALLVFLLLATSLAQDPKAKNDMVIVHVSKSRLVLDHESRYQELDVVIDQKHYVLQSELAWGTLLAPGDYKAKLVMDQHTRAYESKRIYQFQFDDGKKKDYLVIEQE